MDFHYFTIVLLIHVELCGIEGRSSCSCRCSSGGSASSRSSLSSGRIFAGEESSAGGRPFQVGLINNGSFCGASIYNSRTIITAAHCVSGNSRPSDLRLYLGTLDAPHKLIREIAPFTGAVELTRHPNWKWTPTSGIPVTPWDIALITVSTPIRYSNIIQPIGIVEPGISLAGKTAVVSGWGTIGDSDGVKQYARTLKQASGTILSRTECEKKTLAYFNYSGPLRLPSAPGEKPLLKTICVLASEADGPAGQGSCSGDSGGPLTCQVGGTTKLCGVVSAVYACGGDVPQQYAEINDPEIFEWIQKNAGEADTPPPIATRPKASTFPLFKESVYPAIIPFV